MSKYFITIYSKNKTALEKFLIFLKKKLPILKLQIISKYKREKKKTTIINILKSPHVNKTAQEKFKYTEYSLKISTCSFRACKYLLYFKKLNNNLFPDIKTKIVTSIHNKKTRKLKIKLLNLDKFLLNSLKIKGAQKLNSKNRINIKGYHPQLIEKTVNYLKILDCLGELYLYELEK